MEEISEESKGSIPESLRDPYSSLLVAGVFLQGLDSIYTGLDQRLASMFAFSSASTTGDLYFGSCPVVWTMSRDL